MKLRIVEFKEANENGDRFFVEIGTRFYKKMFGFIPVPHTNWEKNKEDPKGTAGKPVVIGHRNIEEALAMCEELKQQIPTYHRIL